MDPAFEDVGDDTSSVRPGLLRPADQPLRCPFGVFAVALGHVLGLGSVAAFVQRAQMAGHSLVGVEALHRLRRQAHFELVLHQLVRHRVVIRIATTVELKILYWERNGFCLWLKQKFWGYVSGCSITSRSVHVMTIALNAVAPRLFHLRGSVEHARKT